MCVKKKVSLTTLLDRLVESSGVGGYHEGLTEEASIEFVFHVAFGVEIPKFPHVFH